MRIIAGEYRSRVLKAASGNHTRPTTDKIKEAIFSRIGPYFSEGMMLDLFAGSAGIGLEAISRGIEKVYFVDHHIKAIHTIKENIRSLNVEKQCVVWKADYKKALQLAHEEQLRFHIIFLDPPYQVYSFADILAFIDEHDLLQEDGYLICESAKEEQFEDHYHHFKKVKEAVYGITRITYYKGEKR
ncbi:MAG: 16S rRNA (guanine(966)-N(2))-methyltransferase RsmD [Erysipelotrichaceae bacterium]|nr:16S rRNA (guanine(966)-N(2))-methyltransferase RsmD [Erysipelotrichaceae bacterium]